jgi:hypothetical protein
MPRRNARKCARRQVDNGIASPAVAWALRYGEPILLPAEALTTASDWRRLWNQYGSATLAEFLKDLPGMRPDSMRLAELLPAREVVAPATPSSMAVYRCEAQQLLEAGHIERDEYTRHFESGTHDTYCKGHVA